MGRIRLGHEAADVEHERIIGAGLVRFDLGQDRVQQICVMNPRIEDFWRRTPDRAGDQGQSGFRIDWRLVFREHDQGRTRLVQPGIHAGGSFHAAGQRQTNMNAVSHFVGGECPPDFIDDFFIRRNFGKGERLRGTAEPGEVFVQFEDAAIIEPQSFPDRIATLHRRIERADAGFVPVHELAVDVHQAGRGFVRGSAGALSSMRPM